MTDEPVARLLRECGHLNASASRLLTQDATSAFLETECGIKVAPSTLKKWRSVGGGPPFYRARGKVFYDPEGTKAWGLAQRSRIVRSTSELDHHAAA